MGDDKGDMLFICSSCPLTDGESGTDDMPGGSNRSTKMRVVVNMDTNRWFVSILLGQYKASDVWRVF